MCTCLLPRVQQMDKDLPNGSGEGGMFSVLVCVCTLPVGRHREGSQTSPAELCSSVTLKIPLVQGQLLFPMAVTEGGWSWAAWPAPPSLPTGEDHQTLPPLLCRGSWNQAQPGRASGVCVGLAGVVLPQGPFSNLLLQHTEPLPLSGQLLPLDFTAGSQTWLSLAGAGLLLLLLLPQPGSWGCAGWSLLLSPAEAAWECPAPPQL